MPTDEENPLENTALNILQNLAQWHSPRPQLAIPIQELARDLIVCGFGGCD